jgi:hypothetical protein
MSSGVEPGVVRRAATTATIDIDDVVQEVRALAVRGLSQSTCDLKFKWNTTFATATTESVRLHVSSPGWGGIM